MAAPRNQRGIALVMALVILVILTMIAVSAARSTSSSIRIVGNMQAKDEVESAVQVALERTISNVAHFNFDPAMAPGATLDPVDVDINGDGVADYTVTVFSPVCLGASIMTGYSATVAESAPMMSHWDVTAELTDTRTGATARISQGIRISLLPNQACSPAT